ncbi:hypothetical protein, partial [Bacillus cereus group sp. Bc253]|uniref:hypothetical protein n=1 Tax=Bacillus cereus group sp. Bc253 TaxID=3018103 RepID=UPI003F2718D9
LFPEPSVVSEMIIWLWAGNAHIIASATIFTLFIINSYLYAPNYINILNDTKIIIVIRVGLIIFKNG